MKKWRKRSHHSPKCSGPNSQPAVLASSHPPYLTHLRPRGFLLPSVSGPAPVHPPYAYTWSQPHPVSPHDTPHRARSPAVFSKTAATTLSSKWSQMVPSASFSWSQWCSGVPSHPKENPKFTACALAPPTLLGLLSCHSLFCLPGSSYVSLTLCLNMPSTSRGQGISLCCSLLSSFLFLLQGNLSHSYMVPT